MILLILLGDILLYLYTGTYDGSAWTATTSYPVSQTHYFGGGGGVIDDHLCMGGYKADGGIVKYDTTNLWNGTAWVAKGRHLTSNQIRRRRGLHSTVETAIEKIQ